MFLLAQMEKSLSPSNTTGADYYTTKGLKVCPMPFMDYVTFLMVDHVIASK